MGNWNNVGKTVMHKYNPRKKWASNENHNVKQCNKCGHLYENSFDNFYAKRNYNRKEVWYYMSNVCKKCRGEDVKKRYQNNREERRMYHMVWRAKLRLIEDLDVSDTSAYYLASAGCEMCGKIERTRGYKTALNKEIVLCNECVRTPVVDLFKSNSIHKFMDIITGGKYG